MHGRSHDRMPGLYCSNMPAGGAGGLAYGSVNIVGNVPARGRLAADPDIAEDRVVMLAQRADRARADVEQVRRTRSCPGVAAAVQRDALERLVDRRTADARPRRRVHTVQIARVRV